MTLKRVPTIDDDNNFPQHSSTLDDDGIAHKYSYRDQRQVQSPLQRVECCAAWADSEIIEISATTKYIDESF